MEYEQLGLDTKNVNVTEKLPKFMLISFDPDIDRFYRRIWCMDKQRPNIFDCSFHMLLVAIETFMIL
ncbi:hypothetical protein DERP_011342 [Dermatophagoides pteronyssinus]|uniref:Uncharacterized protein n=1 Tax=Dermatophagoides pteronyssinus TaxID=6956 RepID=A0ABQ8J7X1_DERPT|nr:hypothetical protein DERP_011342 [Dermatophagoides pteronyssinus]